MIPVLLALILAASSADEPTPPALMEAAGRLGEAIRFPTVSTADPAAIDLAAFRGLHEWLASAFPGVHANLDRQVVDDLALLYTWTGEDPSLPPVLLSAHLDVVPAVEDSADRWAHPPFSGAIAEGAVWGRGAMDDKMAALGILEAAEGLIARGFRPKRTILLAFGGDEEINGTRGAREIARRLGEAGVRPALVLDEGMFVTQGILPGVAAPVALIGVAEKGSVSLELSLEVAGGHSSVPPPHTAVGRLAAAITRLEENPMEADLTPPATLMLEAVAPHASGIYGFLFARLWLSKGILLGAFEDKPSTNATVRTTMAATMFDAGEKDNVLPTRATAVVNYRIHPRDTVADVIAHTVDVVDDPEIHVRPIPSSFGSEASPISPHEGPLWELLADSVRATFPEAVVAPALTVGATDARHYTAICDHVYRFVPLRLSSDEIERLHGVGERIEIARYGEVIRFYGELLSRAGGG